jgi:hypothetical protein
MNQARDTEIKDDAHVNDTEVAQTPTTTTAAYRTNSFSLFTKREGTPPRRAQRRLFLESVSRSMQRNKRTITPPVVNDE